MPDETADKQTSQSNMQRRRITLADGRYMIFYTFDGEPAPSSISSSSKTNAESEPIVKPEAEEERRV